MYICANIEIINLLKKSGFNILDSDLKYGLLHTSWIARFEFLTPSLIIDGSHNPDGVLHLKHDLLAQNRKITLITAMMADKEYSECVKIMSEITDDIIVTSLNMPRCCPPSQLAEEFKKHGISAKIISNSKEAVETAIECGNLVCVCGSLYLAGEVRRNFSPQDIQ